MADPSLDPVQQALDALAKTGTDQSAPKANATLRKPIGVAAPIYDKAGYPIEAGYLAQGRYGDARYRQDQSTVGSFNANGLNPGDVFGVAPGYYEGDEYDYMQGKSTEFIAAVQGAMEKAGLYSSNHLNKVWDDESANAFKKVLTYANTTGYTWNSALEDLTNMGMKDRYGNPVGAGSGLPKRAAFTAQVTNPDDLKKVFQQALYNTTGGNFGDPAEVDKYVAAFQAEQTRAQRAQYDAAPYGGTTVDAPDASTMAADQIKAADPGGAAAEKFMAFGNVLENLIGSGGATTGA
jgi:hypothetical protein